MSSHDQPGTSTHRAALRIAWVAERGGTGAANMVSVKPGKSGDLTYRFDTSGTTLIGCHQPGHYEAGMKAMVNVT